MAVLTRLVLVAVLVTSGRVQGVRLSMSPNPIVDGKTPTLTIRCDTDAPSTDRVYAIKITKLPSTTNLAFVDGQGAGVDTSIQQRATATGTVDPAAGSYLVLTFTEAISCTDAGDYSCQYTSQNTASPTVNQTLQAVSDPHSIEMVVTPIMVIYSENDAVELVCSGYIGKPVTGSWIWETRDDAFGSTWTALRPGLTPVDETPAVSGLCQMTGRSTLTFQVQMEDDNRMYRCFFRDSQHSGNFTFNVLPSVPEFQLLTTLYRTADGKMSNLTIRCNTDAPANDTVYVIQITRPPNTTVLATVDSGGAGVATSIQQRATATGAVSPAAESYLVLTFTEVATCNDVGEYACQYRSEYSQGLRSNVNFRYDRGLFCFEMVASPPLVSYSENDTVELVCSGFLRAHEPVSWVWETRDPFNSTWTPLRPGLTPVDETTVESGLGYITGRSRMTFQVQMEDDDRTYRCYYIYPDFSANFTFNIMRRSNPSNPATTPCAGRSNPSNPATTPCAGATVAISVVLAFLLLCQEVWQ